MLKKIKNIVEGWYNSFRRIPSTQKALFDDRLQVCKSNVCGKLKLGICTACGCPVKKKTKALDEDCPENMWNPILYERDGTEFFLEEELPPILWDSFTVWAFIKAEIKPTVDTGERLKRFTWQDWLDFKDYLREKNL